MRILKRQFQVTVEFDPAGNAWVAYVLALDMLSTYGETREEALLMTEEAIAGYLEVAEREGKPVRKAPEPVELVQLDVVA